MVSRSEVNRCLSAQTVSNIRCEPTVALSLAGTKQWVISDYISQPCSFKKDCAYYIETPQLSNTIVRRVTSRPRREQRNRQEHELIVTVINTKHRFDGE
jgi:hypothetical protein